MKLSAALDLVWQLSAQEAANAAFTAIEPEHLLEAVLKFAELSLAQLEKAGIAADRVQPLADEIAQIQAALTQRQIDSRIARRRLRARLGRGQRPAQGSTIHRSPASRERFAVANGLARQQGQVETAVAHLLTALLAAPTPAMIEILGPALDPRPDNPSPLIAPGPDLVALAAAGQIPDHPDRQPECTALLQMWNQPRTRCILLIGTAAATAATVTALAHLLAARTTEALPLMRRLIDLSGLPAEQPTQFPALLAERLGHMAGQEDLVLVLPTLRDKPDSTVQHAYRTALAHVLRSQPPRCLCPVEPGAYQRWLEKDMTWQRIAQIMWLRSTIAAGLPSQL
jgi:hypothetical protein